MLVINLGTTVGDIQKSENLGDTQEANIKTNRYNELPVKLSII